MTPLERAAREIAPYLQGGRIFDDMPKGRAELKAKFRTGEILDINDATQSDALECAGAVLLAIRDPSEGMITAVVQNVGDPSPEAWALGEAACAKLSGPSMSGETACAELVRDWQAMIDKALEEG